MGKRATTQPLIPKGRERVEIRVSNSRFIATIGPAHSVEEARAAVQAIREEMPDATHHVYAFRIGHGGSVTEGMSDDGEPAGTAGPPALAVLRGSGLGDVVLVVTRYFGGTKLGTGGLVAANSDAARAAVAAVETDVKVARIRIQLEIPHHLHEAISRLLVAENGVIESQEFLDKVILCAQIPTDFLEDLQGELHRRSAGKLRVKVVGD